MTRRQRLSCAFWWTLGATVALSLVFGALVFVSWATTKTQTEWQQIDNEGWCYVKVEHREGVWPFHGDEPTIRHQYCRSGDN